MNRGLIIGKYYCDNSDIIYFRLSSMSVYLVFILMNIKYVYYLTIQKQILLVDLSVIENLLPRNHPERIFFRKQRL